MSPAPQSLNFVRSERVEKAELTLTVSGVFKPSYTAACCTDDATVEVMKASCKHELSRVEGMRCILTSQQSILPP